MKKTNQLEAGCNYHIFNRGNNKETIFKEEKNYAYFLKLWTKYIGPVAKTYCYNLLPNHFHFFIRIEENIITEKPGRISRAFSNLFNAYAKAINTHYDRTGSLFQKRFKRKKITNDSHFTKMIGYILTNAVKHDLCDDVREYPYSSFAELLHTEPTDLLRDELMTWFGSAEIFVDFIDGYQEELFDTGSATHLAKDL